MKVWSQRDAFSADLRAHGCGLYAALALLEHVTDGDERPRDQERADSAATRLFSDAKVSMSDFRKRGLTPSEVRRMLGAQRVSCRPAIPVRHRSGVAIASSLADSLEAGSGALVAVRYGVVQDAGKGVTSYRGGHWVAALGLRSGGEVTIADPLRRSTTSWPMKVLADAAAAFGSKPWGNGRGEAIVVNEWPTYRTLMQRARVQRDGYRGQLSVTEKTLEATVSQLAECQHQGGCTPEALAAARAGGIEACRTALAGVE